MPRRTILCFLCLFMFILNTDINIYAEENDDQLKAQDENISLGEKGGYLSGNFLGTRNLNNQIRFTWGEAGKGFAAEQANNLNDVLHGKNAQIIGGDNIVNGADRAIINRDGSTIFIQDKYYSTASKSVNSAFDDATGLYRYIDADGNPMQLEVPKGQGQKAIENMEAKIKDNRVPGVTEPGEAKNLIREGSYTFEQAKNIAKAGNIDSLKYDAKNGAIIALEAMGITFTLDFASCVINGDDFVTALKNASINSLKNGIGVGAIYVISSQLGKTGAQSIFKPATDSLANILGDKASKSLVDLFGYKGQKPTTNTVSGILQSQMLGSTVTIVVFSVPDVIDLFNGRISAKQLAINLSILIGGTAGATVGGLLGASVGPIGTVAGSVLGGLIGSYATDTLLTTVFQTDSEEMYEIITNQFSKISQDYLVSKSEGNEIVNMLQEKLTTDTLKNMFESEDREEFARTMIIQLFEEEIAQREPITIPTQEEVRFQLISQMKDIVFIH